MALKLQTAGTAPDLPDVADLLSAAVAALGGQEREGQQAMATAVAHALDVGEHLAVQAGTGTGKSLAYLVPGIRHAMRTDRTVVVSTATIALQRQLVDRDLPRLAAALEGPLGRAPTFAILKGRNNYLCLNKIGGGPAEDPDQPELFDPFATSRLGREVRRLHKWAADTATGDRAELVPGVSDQAWRQVSVGPRECIGKKRCSFGATCFAEAARARAATADVTVTNHALLAIDAITGVEVLPEHDVVVIDEAHELADRVTSAATAELSSSAVGIAARRCTKLVERTDVDRLHGAEQALAALLDELRPGRWDALPDGVAPVLALLRDTASAAQAAVTPSRAAQGDQDAAAARQAALVAVGDLHDTAVRALSAFDDPDPAKRRDVVWLADERIGDTHRRVLRIAPLSVAGLLRGRLFATATVVLTSATLQVGGNFDGLAVNWGLPRRTPPPSTTDLSDEDAKAPEREPEASLRWDALDVGSPFDHARAGILYVAEHLPAPGRDGLPAAYIDEIEQLVTAAGGRTLGLFSSMRAARTATEALRERLTTPILCQGEDATGALVDQFAADPATSLFGTLTLWQGVDVPGPSLTLVILDRIPFPRPDDPLLVARQRAVEARGGNGFIAVPANHAALLLAQGVGRLLRSIDDRGVVAMLDPRLATARYSGYLRASLPPFWRTSDPRVARDALRRLAADSGPDRPRGASRIVDLDADSPKEHK
jgi:ATP-dependent DNA helicase DinG